VRGKLYIWDPEKKDWRERGVGVLKLNVPAADDGRTPGRLRT